MRRRLTLVLLLCALAGCQSAPQSRTTSSPDSGPTPPPASVDYHERDPSFREGAIEFFAGLFGAGSPERVDHGNTLEEKRLRGL